MFEWGQGLLSHLGDVNAETSSSKYLERGLSRRRRRRLVVFASSPVHQTLLVIN